MGGKGGAPSTPNYVGAAAEQGEQNRKSFLEGLGATRIDQTNPYGSQTWQYTGPDRGKAPSVEDYLAKVGQATTATPASSDNGYRYGGGLGGALFSPDKVDNVYSEAEARRDYQAALDAYNSAAPGPGDWTLKTTLSPEMQKIFNTGYGAYNKAAAGLASTPLDTSGLVDRGDWSRLTAAMAGDGSGYTDAYYNKATRLLGDKYSREQEAIRTQLLNSGLSEGTEAYDNQMRQFMDAKNRNYSDIADQAILSGSTLRNQDISGLVTGLSAQDQARAGNLQELTYLRNLPMADAQMILQGLQMPNFSGGGGGSGGGFAAGDYQSALGNQFNADTNKWNANQAQNAQTAQTGISLATLAYALASSDRRLKSNIHPLGRKNSKGFNLYSYTKYGATEIGLMADEVMATMPEAVILMPSGYYAVRYDLAGGV